MMDMMFYEVFQEEEKVLKRYLPKEIQAGFTAKTIQAEDSKTPPSPLISIRTQSLIPSAWIEKLSGILTRSVGFDHLMDLQKRGSGKLAFGYLPSYCERSVAEHAILVALSLARGLKKQIRHFETFDRDHLTGSECFGRNVLVVGVGRIGSEMVRLAQGLGMQVKGVDLVKKVKTLTYVPLEEGIRFAEMILCALPLTKLTKGMLNEASLKHAKPGTFFVNISRGEISPVADLKRLLDEGILGGIGLDIYEDEKQLAEYLRTKKGALTESGKTILSLKDRDNVILTPHNAFNTEEALERKAKQSIESTATFLKEKSFPYPVPFEEGEG